MGRNCPVNCCTLHLFLVTDWVNYIRKGRNGDEGRFLEQQWTSVLKVIQSKTNGQKKMTMCKINEKLA